MLSRCQTNTKQFFDQASVLPKYTLIATGSILSCISMPIFIIECAKLFGQKSQQEQASFSRLLPVLLPWAALAMLHAWRLSNGWLHRMNGQVDQPVLAETEFDQSHHSRIIILLIANLSGFTNAALVAFLAFKQNGVVLQLAIGAVLGSLSYLIDLLTDLADAFRKHVEHYQAKNIAIKPFHAQPIVKLIYAHTNFFAVVLREVYPLLSGIIRAQIMLDVMRQLIQVSGGFSNLGIILLSVPLWLLAYGSAAVVAKYFELVQIDNYLQAAGKTDFTKDNFLLCYAKASTSEQQASRLMMAMTKYLGQIQSGELLLTVYKALKFPEAVCVVLLLIFDSLSRMAALYVGLNEYILSSDRVVVQHDEAGVLIAYLLNNSYVFQYALTINIPIAVIIGIVTSAIRKPTVSASVVYFFHEPSRIYPEKRYSLNDEDKSAKDNSADNDDLVNQSEQVINYNGGALDMESNFTSSAGPLLV